MSVFGKVLSVALLSGLVISDVCGETWSFNKRYELEDITKPIAWVDTKAALSAVALHRGVLFAPLGYDHGGGQGRGAFALYNVDDPTRPRSIFDSRDYKDLYHKPGEKNYVGDFAEAHAMSFSGDLVMMSERRPDSAGFSILDLKPLFDEDPESKPSIVGRFSFPGVQKPTNYDGYSFSPVWAGGRYLYAPTGSHGLYIVDTSNPAVPKLVAHMPKSQLYNENLRAAVVIGDLLILSPSAVASTKGSMVLVDVSNPAKPVLLNKHKVNLGYQGFVYGSKFYGGGTREKDYRKPSRLITYDFSDPSNIVEELIGTTKKLIKPEYGYAIDGTMYLGHYPGLAKFKVINGKAEYETAVEPQFPHGDDYAFISPLGNLAVVTSDHNVRSRMNIGIHDREPDLRGPELCYVLPERGRVNVTSTTKIGIAFSDFIDPLTVNQQTVVVRKVGDNLAIDCGYSHCFGIVNIVPKVPLEENCRYEVVIIGNLTDQMRNSFVGEKVVTQFSTGAETDPVNVALKADKPAVAGSVVSLSVEVLGGTMDKQFTYDWDFGDGETIAGSNQHVTHRYKKAGNYVVTLSLRQLSTGRGSKHTVVQVIHNPLPDSVGTSSSTIVFDGHSDRVYVVNPDNNTVSAINSSREQLVYEVPAGINPVSVTKVNAHLWISNSSADTITIVDAVSGRFVKTLKLPYGASPHGIVYNKTDGKCYVAMSGSGYVVAFDSISCKEVNKLHLGGSLRHIAYSAEHRQLIIPEFTARGERGGIVYFIDSRNFSLSKQITLEASMDQDGLNNGRGVPNYLGALAVNPDQSSVWIPGKKDNIFRGGARDGKPLSFDHTVRSMAAHIALPQAKEDFERRIDIDNSDFATSAAFSPYGNVLFLATMGSSKISVIDAYDEHNRFTFDASGLGPLGMVLNYDGSRLFIHNYLSRSVDVFNTTNFDKIYSTTSISKTV